MGQAVLVGWIRYLMNKVYCTVHTVQVQVQVQRRRTSQGEVRNRKWWYNHWFIESDMLLVLASYNHELPYVSLQH